MAETWSPVRSAARKAEIEQWLAQVAVLENACRETKNALVKMVGWSNAWSGTTGNGGQGGVEKLTAMSLKKVIPGIVRQFSAIEIETSRLPRQPDLEEGRPEEGWDHGRTWYNATFSPSDARVVETCVGIHDSLVAVQFFVDLWRNNFGAAEEWQPYDSAMEGLESLAPHAAPAAQAQTHGAAIATLAEMRACCVRLERLVY